MRASGIGRLVAACVALFACVGVHAQTCYTWKVASFGGASVASNNPAASSPAEAAAAYVVYRNSITSSQRYTYTSCAVGTWPAHTCGYSIENLSGGVWSPGGSGSMTVNGTSATGGCPACPAAGTKITIGGTGDISSAGATACSDGCAYNKDSLGVQIGSSWAQGYKATGSACAAMPATANYPSGTEASCMQSGTILGCAQQPPEKCGEFNGDIVCIGQQQTGCTSYPSGAVACIVEGGTVPDGPDNGTPGTPATPDGFVTRDGVQINYYSNTTVQGSSSAPTTGAPTGGGPTGSGVGAGGQPSNDDEGEDDPGGAEFAALGDVESFGAMFGAFADSVAGSPIGSAMSSMGLGISAGTCPTTTFSLFGQTYTVDPFCDGWESLGSILSTVCLFGWAIAAARVLFSA